MTYIPLIRNARIENDAVTSAKVLDGTLTDLDIAAANKDGVAGTPSLRTLGGGAQQALAGNTTLDAIANPVADLDMDGFKITDLGNPTLAQDAATKAYVDSLAVGLDPKESVLYTTTDDITLSGLATQGDGTWPSALTAGDRILVKDQTAADENGIYAAAAGAWTRTTDFDGTPAAEVSNGAFTLVAAGDGTDHVGTGWVVTSADPIVVNTDPIVFTQITSPGAVNVLDDLTDVNVAAPTLGAILHHDGTEWIDSANVRLDDSSNQFIFPSNATIRDNGGDLEIFSTADVKLTPSAPGRVVSEGLHVLQAGQAIALQEFAADHAVDLYSDYLVVLNTAGAVRTATLPSGATTGSTVVIKRKGANNAEIATAGAETIDGSAANYVIDVNYMSVTVVFDGTEWLVI